jgi:hypothetical protein
MPGFRETFGLNQGVNESEELCDDDVGSSAIIVSLPNAYSLLSRLYTYVLLLCKIEFYLPNPRDSLLLFYPLDVWLGHSLLEVSCIITLHMCIHVLSTTQLFLAFSDFAGRKIAIIIGGVLYGVGGVLQSAAYFLWFVQLF